MVKTASTMLPLGTQAPEFQLPDVVSGATISLSTFANQQALLVIFMCQHCPFVKHVQAELAKIGHDYQNKGLGMVAISANDVTKHPSDSPDHLKAMADEVGFTFPVCYDESQETAKIYTAACTPDFFLFDGDRHLVYRGQLDDSRPGNDKPVNGRDLRAAIEAALAHQPIDANQKPSIGCNIKWKAGNEPAYFGTAATS
ncbi:thioredoxin family protein [Oculatella sp. LEGE 06141]|uniref:thioredoxin family protein n=1 Tax=Oculatella sp. LEGE 06141 TaxID=1828648 RepID=UPI0018813410|nr:thioredoxin family protein [Oculatella sp. LEGE 06141]MBE9177413.1 thioredoxin family protein [Oculatella sp. LEGE 06141]